MYQDINGYISEGINAILNLYLVRILACIIDIFNKVRL